MTGHSLATAIVYLLDSWRCCAAVALMVVVCAWGIAEQNVARGQSPLLKAATQLPTAPSPPHSPAPNPVLERLPAGPAEQLLSLGELEQMALFANPAVGQAAAMVGAARGNWIQVGLLPNPEVGYEGQQLGSGGLAEQQGILVGQELVTAGKLRLNRAVADRQLAQAQQQLAAQQQRVLTDVRMAYYHVLLAQRQIDLTSSLVEISTQGAEAVHTLFRAQEASRADVLQSQLEVENAKILAQNAHNRHTAAWQNLTAVVGNPHLPPQGLAGDAFTPPREYDYQFVLTQLQQTSPEIAMAVFGIERARATLARAQVEPIPNITLGGVVNVIDNGIGGNPDGNVVVSVPVPLFNRNQGAILQAQHEVAAARKTYEQLELNLQQRLAATFERYANARNQVERYRTAILPAANESLELTRKMYEAGETNYVGLLIAQRTYFQMNIHYLEAIETLRIAETEIEGQLLSGSLQSR